MNPAAVLSIMVKAQGVQATIGDLDKLDSSAKKTGTGLGKVAKVAAVGLAGGMAAGAVAVKKFVDAASESQVSTSKMKTQLKALGIDYGKHASQIDKVIAKHSALSGLDDEDLQDSFTNLVRTTKDVTGALKLNAIAADLARAKGIGLDAASKLVQKAHMGQAGALKRVGIEAETVTAAQQKVKDSLDKYRASHKKISPEMKAHFDQLKEQAKEQDKVATGQDLIARLQKGFSGQAKAYGDTAAGAQEKFSVAVENLQEALGQRLLPIVTKVAGSVADFVNGMSTGEGAGGRFVAALTAIAGAFKDMWGWVQKNKDLLADLGIVVALAAAAYAVSLVPALIASTTALYAQVAAWVALRVAFLASPIGMAVIALTALVAGLVLAYKHSETFRNVVNGAFDAVKSVAVPVVQWLATAIPDAWNWIKTATLNLWGWIAPYLSAAFEVIKTAVTTYFKAYWAIIQGIWTAVKTVTTTLWGWFGPYIKVAFEIVKTAVVVYFQIYKTIIAGVWNAIKTLTTALWDWFGPYLKAAWDLLKTAATVAWGLIKIAIINPIKAAKDAIAGIWDDIKRVADKAWDRLTGAAGTFAAGLKDKISGAFRDAANLVVGFVNQIIDVVNKIPGVKVDKIKPLADGANGMARGGAFARTGGLVRSPITLMGEEAPRYPEYVIPTNPAYRGRARGLLAQAAGSLGFASGGVWSKSQLSGLWSRVNPGLGDPNLMAAIALAESSGDQNARNPSGASGLWQILGLPFPGNPFDPETNARMAGSKLSSQGLGAWEVYTSGAYKQFLGGGGVIGKIGDALGGAFDLLKNGAKALLGKLPGASDLGWLKGLGDHALGKVGDWIKGKAGGLLSGGGGDAGSASGLSGAVAAALAFARSHGWSGSVVSGFRSRAEQEVLYARYLAGTGNKAAPPGSSMHERGLAVDVSDTEGFARAMGMMGVDALMRKVAGEPWHFSTTGYARGGILGSYKNGTPFVPQTGAYLLHKGESVIPYASGGVVKGIPGAPLGPQERMTPLQFAAYVRAAEKFTKITTTPPQKGLPAGSSPVPVAVVSAPAVDGATENGGPDPNQALIESNAALQASIDKQAAELAAVRASIDAQTNFAKGVEATPNFQLTKSLSDLLSGHIVGRGVAGRAFTPGSGVEYQY